ncbi:hypothetical protein [Flavobacterium sp.]|uniref:hypothetical protein n=1 Tax=Flavobacterium sp. TaxID=239 RepID=UPI0037C16007
MKKIVLLLLVSLIGISCSVSDDNNNYYYEILPVESYEIPASFELGEIYTIKLFYKLPSDCHVNPTLYFEKKGQIRTVAVQSFVANRNDCNFIANEDVFELKFQFEVINSEAYVFKFYKGEDENGEPLFENVTIPVTNE